LTPEHPHAASAPPHRPHIVPRHEHSISRSRISDNALRVLNRLNEAGFAAHLVGGAVRDLLLGASPKDFDIATDARPEQVRALFRNCRLIGRRFRLAHVFFGQEIIEVATFRAQAVLPEEDSEAEDSDAARLADNGRILRDNVYGSIEDDAWRRDLTVNALYYSIKDFSVLDYVGGAPDLERRLIRLIGDPEKRYREDPVRMLRVARFAAKLGFEVEPGTAAPIAVMGHLLDDISSARLYEESIKLFQCRHAVESLAQLRRFGLFGYLFLQTEDALAGAFGSLTENMLQLGLANTAQRIAEGKPVTPAYLYAFMLWGPLREALAERGEAALHSEMDLIGAGGDVFSAQAQQTGIPRRFSLAAREIWQLQARFHKRQGRQPQRFVTHPRFRAAYDFLLLRRDAGEMGLEELCQWWTEFQALDESQQALHLRHVNRDEGRRPHRRHKPAAPEPEIVA
jgi:poly(A) polymerase